MNEPTATVTEAWIHADVCPFIVTEKCSLCSKTATLCRVVRISGLPPEFTLFCSDCTPIVRVNPALVGFDDGTVTTTGRQLTGLIAPIGVEYPMVSISGYNGLSRDNFPTKTGSGE